MFQKARIKLTAWYLLIITLISVVFSGVIFQVQMVEVNRFARAQRIRIQRQIPEGVFLPPEPPFIDPDLVAETQKRLLLNLIFLNSLIIVISGGLGYFLAGKTLRPIKEMLEDQDRFISDSSHELRTPLTSLKSAMEVALMDKKMTLEETKNLIKENIEDVNKLQKLSDSLILLTKQSSKKEKHYQVLTTKQLIEDSIQQIKAQATKKKITIISNIKNVKFQGENDKLTNLVAILLENAIKYSKNNKIVKIKTWKTKNHVNITVKDGGIGISEKDIPHIFDRFYRADISRSKIKTSGYGLGLSIAKMIVDEHHGTISVKSIIKKGSQFLIRLPIKNI
jgi:two-component system, OmpR family, sensor histidine kinase CiaH